MPASEASTDVEPASEASTDVETNKACIICIQRKLYDIIDELEKFRKENATLNQRKEEAEEQFHKFLLDMSEMWEQSS